MKSKSVKSWLLLERTPSSLATAIAVPSNSVTLPSSCLCLLTDSWTKQAGTCPRVTGEIWHELIVWDGGGHKGAKCKKKKKNSLCQPVDARMWPVTAAWVMAGHSTCGARVMISDAKAGSEHAVVAWQVYLDGWWQIVELMNTSFFFSLQRYKVLLCVCIRHSSKASSL